MDYFKNIADWFISQTNANKILVLFAAINLFFYLDNKELKTQAKELIDGQKKTDSIYVARLNSVSRDFQEKIDACNKERMDAYLRQSEMWQAKFEELFKETDQVYQQYQKTIENR